MTCSETESDKVQNNSNEAAPILTVCNSAIFDHLLERDRALDGTNVSTSNSKWPEFQAKRNENDELVDLILTDRPNKDCPPQTATKQKSVYLDGKELQAYLLHAKRVLVTRGYIIFFRTRLLR